MDLRELKLTIDELKEYNQSVVPGIVRREINQSELECLLEAAENYYDIKQTEAAE